MKPKKVLIAYSSSSTHVQTTFEYLTSLKGLADCEVQFVHCTNDARMHFDINEFDVLVNNYCCRLCYDWYISPDYERAVLSFRGLKLAIVQDDYEHTAVLQRRVRHLGFHVLFTSIQPEFWPLVYPALAVPGTALRHLLTGYAPSPKPGRKIKPLSDRPFRIAYRGRKLNALYGRLGFEKYEIGRRMAEICEARGLPHNIASDEESRIYGEGWLDFIGDSRAMLGSESGSNVFDFDSQADRACKDFSAQHGRPPEYSEIAEIIKPLEEPFNVGQISPRVFECASMKTPMILFRGQYSGAIEPGVHYIALEKDFSNADDILTKLDDLEYLQGFADRAHDHLIASGRYTYRRLTSAIEEAIAEFYPIVMADKATQHRKAIAPIWTATHDPSDPHEIALGEKPTEEIQLPSEFYAKHDRLADMLRPPPEEPATVEPPSVAVEPPSATVELPSVAAEPPSVTVEPTCAITTLPTPAAFERVTVAQGVWRALPESIRYWIGSKVSRVSLPRWFLRQPPG